MIGVFNEKALLVSRLMKIFMVVMLLGIYFIVKTNTETAPANEANESNKNKTVIVNSEV